MRTVGDRVRQEMRRQKIRNVRALADLAGVDRSTLSRIVRDVTKEPTNENLRRLARGLSVSVDYLLGLGKDGRAA